MRITGAIDSGMRYARVEAFSMESGPRRAICAVERIGDRRVDEVARKGQRQDREVETYSGIDIGGTHTDPILRGDDILRATAWKTRKQTLRQQYQEPAQEEA